MTDWKYQIFKFIVLIFVKCCLSDVKRGGYRCLGITENLKMTEFSEKQEKAGLGWAVRIIRF